MAPSDWLLAPRPRRRGPSCWTYPVAPSKVDRLRWRQFCWSVESRIQLDRLLLGEDEPIWQTFEPPLPSWRDPPRPRTLIRMTAVPTTPRDPTNGRWRKRSVEGA